MAFTVYILHSKNYNRYYIGQTKDLSRRLYEHNSGQSKSTKYGIPWELIYKKQFSTRSQAVKYEKKLKNMKSHNYLEELVLNDNKQSG